MDLMLPGYARWPFLDDVDGLHWTPGAARREGVGPARQNSLTYIQYFHREIKKRKKERNRYIYVISFFSFFLSLSFSSVGSLFKFYLGMGRFLWY